MTKTFCTEHFQKNQKFLYVKTLELSMKTKKEDPGKLSKIKILEGIVGWTLIATDAVLVIGALGYSAYNAIPREVKKEVYNFCSECYKCVDNLI